jgi:RNA polymerase sigma factor (sigma-70 family)
MNDLVRSFDPLTRRLANSMTTCPHLRQDLANAGRMGIVHAVRGHDGRAQGFATYAESFVRGAMWRRRMALLGPTKYEAVSNESNELLDPENTIERLADDLAPWGTGPVVRAIANLTPSQRHIAYLRYIHDASLEEIGAEVQTTAAAVSQRLGTIHRKVEAALAA